MHGDGHHVDGVRNASACSGTAPIRVRVARRALVIVYLGSILFEYLLYLRWTFFIELQVAARLVPGIIDRNGCVARETVPQFLFLGRWIASR